jgi:hypothetical protein
MSGDHRAIGWEECGAAWGGNPAERRSRQALSSSCPVDANGKLIGLGDRVAVGNGITGVGVFSADFPRDDWGYLGGGIMVKTERADVIHLDASDEDLDIITKFPN